MDNRRAQRRISATLKVSKKLLMTLIMCTLAIIWLLPAVLGVFTSFKSFGEFMKFSKLRNIIPLEWTLDNYKYVLDNAPVSVLTLTKNSLIVSCSTMVLVVFITSTSAYAYERLQFKGKELLFWTLMGLNMIPDVVGFVAQYYMYHDLGITNTLLSLITPALGGTFNIFLIRNFMTGIPKEMDEAARIDGASEFQIYAQIVLPSIMPVLMVIGMHAFNGAWNDMMWPSLSISDPSKLTVSAGVRTFYNTFGRLQWKLAGAMMAAVPTVIVYLIAGKYFLQGMHFGTAVKG